MTAQQPLVSVIIASYNQARFIRNAIESVFQQTFKEYEIIVIDDGSTDGSFDELANIQQKHGDSIGVYTHSGHVNRGIVETYKLGISKARAPFLAFLEGDDAWSPNYLAEKVCILQKYADVGVVFSPCKILHEGVYGLDMILRQSVLHMLFPKRRAFNNFKNLLRHNNIATFSAFVTRTSLVKGLEWPGNPSLPYLDWWMLVQLSIRAGFYLDDKSRVTWRLSRSSFLGGLSFQDHKQGLAVFFDEMYSCVDGHQTHLADRDIAAYQKMRKAKAHFLEFYTAPSIAGFLRLIKREARWALESLASYVVNSVKHA